MKILKTTLKMVLLCGMLFYFSSTVFAVPPLPSSFYGLVKVDGENVEAGTIISAKINGVTFASGPVLFYEGDSVYSLDVPGDDPSTSEIEGGLIDEQVNFYIGELQADQSGTWSGGTNTQINITASSEKLDYEIFLPLILR